MTPLFTMREALEDPALLGNVLSGPSWATWRVMLMATNGDKLRPAERKVFTQFTGRETEPGQPIEEAVFVVGRRGGKDRSAAIQAVYVAALCDHRDVLVPVSAVWCCVCRSWHLRAAAAVRHPLYRLR
jgi:hypothetical protein